MIKTQPDFGLYIYCEMVSRCRKLGYRKYAIEEVIYGYH